MTKQRVEERRGSLRLLPYRGIIAVVAEAEKRGYPHGFPDWINLGQGQPEVGEIEGAPRRLMRVDLHPEDHAYGPVHGTLELREAVAAHYNRLYRKGRSSQYTADNVAVASGGRVALSRSCVALGRGKIGYMVPDYSAYEDMLELHMHRCEPVPVFTRPDEGWRLRRDAIDALAKEHAIESFLLSNPCNPTGAVVEGEELAGWVETARRRELTLICDEFYSHFTYTEDGRPAAGPVSAAAHVEDVDRDPVLLVDGLTKSYRYPGWRIGWAVGPKSMIECFVTAGSSLDGGPSRIAQRAALEVLEPARADQETDALRVAFAKKRNLMIEGLERMGITIAGPVRGTFYVFGCLAGLKPPFDDSWKFFSRALDERVVTVPGPFFDVNPGRRRDAEISAALRHWMRFSFGPPQGDVERGLDRLEAMLARG